MVTKRDNPYKVKTVNANIWCHATNDVGFTRPENFASDLSMKLLATVLGSLGVIWPFLQVIGHISTEAGLWNSIFQFTIFDWIQPLAVSFLKIQEKWELMQ